jgi:hypothetical protein
MDFDKDDIALGKRLAKQYSTNHDALEELANKVETKYGDGTLEYFAEAIGIAYSTLKNCRHVHRKWINSPVKPKNFSVAKALASYKDKDDYIQQHPNATEKEARAHVRASRELARDKKAADMLDSEKKGFKLGNWTRAAEKLIKDMHEILLDKWDRKLDALSQRRIGLELGVVAELIMTLERSSNILFQYKEKFKASAMIKEYERDIESEKGHEESQNYTEERLEIMQAEADEESFQRRRLDEIPKDHGDQEDMGTREMNVSNAQIAAIPGARCTGSARDAGSGRWQWRWRRHNTARAPRLALGHLSNLARRFIGSGDVAGTLRQTPVPRASV